MVLRAAAAGLVLVLGVQAMWAGAAWLTLPAVAVVWGLLYEVWMGRPGLIREEGGSSGGCDMTSSSRRAGPPTMDGGGVDG